MVAATRTISATGKCGKKMIFPRREDATNKELIRTIIDIQGYLSRYGSSHTNWHETLNEVIARLEQAESVPQESKEVPQRMRGTE